VKPMPKAGWSLSTVQGRYAAPHDLYGKPVSEGVTEVVWTGALADEHYDEFVLRGRVSGAVAPGTSLAFPVVQECESAAERWVEVPTPGADAQALRHPAPALRIVAPRVVQVAETSATVIVGDLAIEAPWSRATPGGAKVAAGYLKVTNRGSAPDRLIGGSFAAAGRVELHESRTENGVMRMRALERMEIAPGATLELQPGGDHLMLLDLARPLKEGERVKGTLVFERAGTVEVTFAVQGLAARGSGEHHHHH
jgi:periplasmic copper chaperone A